MPTISTFYGIFIQMFWEDHAPPHFHARYGDYKGIINIHTLQMIEGNLPRRALSLILDWDLCIKKQRPHKIEPLK